MFLEIIFLTLESVSLSIHGTNNVFNDNRHGLTEAEIILSDGGTEYKIPKQLFHCR